MVERELRAFHDLLASGRTMRRRHCRWIVSLLLAGISTAPLAAALCSVPGTHPDVRCAVRDLTCTEIAIGAGSFEIGLLPIARDLSVHGLGPGSTTLNGQIQVSGATSDLTLESFRLDATGAGVSGCVDPALSSSGGASVTSGVGLEVVDIVPTGICAIFIEGFEGGSLCPWSSVSP